MPGSGKSSLGLMLSKLMDLPFIDTDSQIVEKNGKSIVEIFHELGEKSFREFERQMLEEIIEQNDSVISVGGGMPCFLDNMDLMNANAVTVYLKLSSANLFQTLKNDSRRPLLQGKTQDELKEYIRSTLQQRSPYYEKADIHINSRAGSPAKLARLLYETVNEKRRHK
jgi:shikimate kinase